MKRNSLRIVIAVVVIAVLIQLIPLDRSNPAATREVAWDAPQTRALAARACLDCHSNETTWPWYARIAPASMLLVNHVQEGRGRLNFSQWDRPNAGYEEVEKQMQTGKMPLWDYVLMHPAANLTAAEEQQLLAGLQATFAADPAVPSQ